MGRKTAISGEADSPNYCKIFLKSGHSISNPNCISFVFFRLFLCDWDCAFKVQLRVRCSSDHGSTYSKMFTKANLRPILYSSLAANFYSGYLTIIGIFLLALHTLRLVVKSKHQPIWQTPALQAHKFASDCAFHSHLAQILAWCFFKSSHLHTVVNLK